LKIVSLKKKETVENCSHKHDNKLWKLCKSQPLIFQSMAVPHFRGVKFLLIREKYSSENIYPMILWFLI